MSTKIYNGIKFNSNSLYEILQQLTTIKADAYSIGIKQVKGELPFFIYDLHLIIKSIQKKLILAAYRHM